MKVLSRRIIAASIAVVCLLVQVRSAHAQSPAGVDGVYTGTYRCAQGITNARLSLAITAGGELVAHLTFYLPPGTRANTYTYMLFGQYSPATAKFSLMPTRWESAQPANVAMMGMNGSWDSNELTGTMVGNDCSTFQLERERSGPNGSAAAGTSAPPANRAPTQAANNAPAATRPAPAAQSPAAARPSSVNFDDALARVQKMAEAEKAAAAAGPPVANESGLKWVATTKKDQLTDAVSTQLMAQMDLKEGAARGDFMQAQAFCTDKGITVFFYLGSRPQNPKPEFAWNQSGTSSVPTMDIRMRVDGGAVHVAQGYPDQQGSTLIGNSLGLLFYEPGMVDRAARDAQAATTGIPLDSFWTPVMREAVRSQAQNEAANSAGPLRQAVNARSIRIELPIVGYGDNPVLELNPQSPAFHSFATQCSTRFTPAR